jgi:hypothetical protein
MEEIKNKLRFNGLALASWLDNTSVKLDKFAIFKAQTQDVLLVPWNREAKLGHKIAA